MTVRIEEVAKAHKFGSPPLHSPHGYVIVEDIKRITGKFGVSGECMYLIVPRRG